MKTDANKAAKNVFKTERSVFDVRPKVRPASSPGAFEKIMEENRRDGRRTAKSVDGGHGDSAGAGPVLDAAEDPLDRIADEKARGREDEGGDGEHSQSGGDSDGQPAGQNFGSSGPAAPRGNAAANSPPARSILHVADLERIVATVRTENFKTHKQVTLALRNSVLEGVEIRLALDGDGRLTARFASKNADVRRRLGERRDDLKSILESRNLKVESVEVVEL